MFAFTMRPHGKCKDDIMPTRALRLVSFNIFYALRSKRLAKTVMAAFEALDPDVICLQEVLIGKKRNFARDLADALGLHLSFCLRREYGARQIGLATLSRDVPEENTAVILPHSPASRPRIVQIIQLIHRGIAWRIANTHLSNVSASARAAQIKAIRGLERSLADARPRALIQMASGGGKTFTACNFCYRLIKHAGARRILFLVDRKTLGRQAKTEFAQFTTPEERRKFTELYNVQLLQSNKVDPVAKVSITTIQRLYSMLKGEADIEDPELEEKPLGALERLLKEPVPVGYNPAIPVEFFDFIVVDECHRSIYNLWRQV